MIRESFTSEERERLQPFFTNTDDSVFALVNMPDTVKGAMFARYSRYQGTLRRMFLDEFSGDLDTIAARAFDGVEGERAAKLYERIFLGYGDDSVAQLGGAHIACEWVSNILTKQLQRGRLAAYLEQSTRYIPYDSQMPGGGYRFHRNHELGKQYGAAMDKLFSTYASVMPRVMASVAAHFPVDAGQDEAAHRRAVAAKALDLLRGLLPAASLSHMGIYASGQAYENLLLRLAASPLPEARACGEQILRELQKVIPSFVQRLQRPDRGGRWIEYLGSLRENGERWSAKLGIGEPVDQSDLGPSVRLLEHEGDERGLAAALLYETSTLGESRVREAIDELDDEQLAALLADMAGKRENRRHRPGRGFETLRYRFEIVSDYGAFRDLQRHRMLTCQWQTLTPYLGADVPEELERADAADAYRKALDVSRKEYERLVSSGHAEHAPYALCLAYRIRYVLDLNAREAMQLIELRSGREGHPAYRAVAHAMWDQINAVHPAVAQSMKFVDRETEPRLERLTAEMRNSLRAG